jgi:hypothetical protein
MKQTSIRPRALFGFLRPSILLLLALVALVSFPTSSALARPKCDPVEIYYEYESGYIAIYMATDTPTPCKILFTTNGQNPTHDANGNPTGGTAVYFGPMLISLGQCKNIRALTFKAYPYVDSDISADYICNPPQ